MGLFPRTLRGVGCSSRSAARRLIGLWKTVLQRDVAPSVQSGEVEKLRTLFQVTFDTVPVGIAHVALDGSWLRVNTRLCRMLGYTEAELRQRRFQDVTYPADLDADLYLLEELLRGEITEYQLEKRYLHKDGSPIWALLQVSMLRKPNGAPDHFVSVVSDTQTLKGLEQRLQLQKQALVEANESLEGFAYSISHDLRAPLRATGRFAAILADHIPDLDGEGQHALAGIRRNADRMGRLIDGLLSFARFGRQAMTVEGVDMTELAKDACDVALAFLDGSVSKRVEVTAHPLPAAEGDRVLLGQVWANLVSNALKFSQGAAVIRVEIGGCEDESEVRFYVRDNGVGFDPAYASDLFGVFSRQHTREEFDGEGVGLAIVSNIVRRHGGRVWAEGRLGAGACFWFCLPRRIHEAPALV